MLLEKIIFETIRFHHLYRCLGYIDDDDDDETISYVRPLLQLQTVTSVLMIRSDEQFSFQIATERGYEDGSWQLRSWEIQTTAYIIPNPPFQGRGNKGEMRRRKKMKGWKERE